MEDKIRRAIENERIALRRYNKAVKDRVNISYYTGKIQGSNNCIRRLIELLSVCQHETSKVITKEKAKEDIICKCDIPELFITVYPLPNICKYCRKQIISG